MEWLAYDQLDPIGQPRLDFAAALISSVIANVNRDPKQRSEPFTPRDFMILWGEPKPEAGDEAPTVEELLMRAEVMAAAGMGAMESE